MTASTTALEAAADREALNLARDDEALVRRALLAEPHLPVGAKVEAGATLRAVVEEFRVPEDELPAGFRVVVRRTGDRHVLDLVRDIGHDRNGRRRPTPLLFSVDSIDPHEVAPCAPFVANLTCNPGIVYDLFLNNPEANVGGEFETLDEVLRALADILGPGCDVSVELHNPFESDLGKILEEVARYEEILTRHRLVVKVPHTGPVNAASVPELLEGSGRHQRRYNQGATADYLAGHALALELESRGYRVNFTLMFEPHQTPMALQARPYFINAFLRNRLAATSMFTGLMAAYEATGNAVFVTQMRDFMIANDYLAPADADMDRLDVLEAVRTLLRLREAGRGPDDGLDNVRQSLRWLETSNLDDSRLILCSMDGESMYPDIVRMLAEPEFLPMHHRVLLTTDPAYLARWSSTPQVISYQRRFMKAARTVNESVITAAGG